MIYETGLLTTRFRGNKALRMGLPEGLQEIE